MRVKERASMSFYIVLLLTTCFLLITSIPLSYGYDPLDPNGNVTIKWDLMQSGSDTTDVKVSISNYQLYRHIEQPGWKLTWDWTAQEVIWQMWGAEATLQGDCSRLKGANPLPHCCDKTPVIVDLLPGAPYNLQTANCCKGGLLSSIIQDPSKFGASFQMNVGAANFVMPQNFSLNAPGYTCSHPLQVPETKYSSDGGRRWTQALGTWDVNCVYSQFAASASPKCCVSLSAFYSRTIVPCPICSCSCPGLPTTKCVKFGETPSLLQQKQDQDQDQDQEPYPLVRCSNHMCPIQVHWHVKQSYKEYWRVKMTVTNLNILRNYSRWNLVVLHPNLQSLTRVFSFNYKPLNQYGYINDSGMFWGIQYYNDMLLQEGKSGNVQSEMLLRKDPGLFTFREGWAFPRRISFDGDECVMPPPDEYPRLPNGARAPHPFALFVPLLSLLVVF